MARYFVLPDGTRVPYRSPNSSNTSSESDEHPSTLARELLPTDLLASPRKRPRPRTSILRLQMAHGMPGAFRAQHAAESIHGITERMENIDMSSDDSDSDLLPPAPSLDPAGLLASTATRPEAPLTRLSERGGAVDVHVAAEPWDPGAHAGADRLWCLWWPAGRGVHVLRRGAGAGGGAQGLATRIRCAGDVACAPAFHLLWRGRRLGSMRLATLEPEARAALVELAVAFSARERLVGDGAVGRGELKTHQEWLEGLLFEAVEHGICEGHDCLSAMSQLSSGSSAALQKFEWGGYQY
ncbi:hypothetical protein PsYK624_030930 [Phanerochaete sordida]|uniref:Uncharacterized protein n=1 Tax=Phanerochaete sordida TaxID=48140 RepID=A0A9P3L9C9_9APHY|nr:hypothetical protein PsYK624_030930 [Phanerochaete sordida]